MIGLPLLFCFVAWARSEKRWLYGRAPAPYSWRSRIQDFVLNAKHDDYFITGWRFIYTTARPVESIAIIVKTWFSPKCEERFSYLLHVSIHSKESMTDIRKPSAFLAVFVVHTNCNSQADITYFVDVIYFCFIFTSRFLIYTSLFVIKTAMENKPNNKSSLSPHHPPAKSRPYIRRLLL